MSVQCAWLAAAISVASLAACQHPPEPVPPGNIADTLVAPTVGEAVFDPASLHGKPAVVMFVSPTCSHCLAEIPRAQDVASQSGASTVAVFVSGNADAAISVVQRTKFKGAVLVDDGKLRAKYKVTAVPYTLVLNPDGTAHSAYRGEQEADTLRDALAAAAKS